MKGLNLISIFASIFSIPLGIYLHWIATPAKCIRFIRRTKPVLMPKMFDSISINYKNEILDNAFISTFIIWNSSSSVINDDDLAPTRKLKITSSSDTKLLSCRLLCSSEKANNFNENLIITDNCINLNFDYIGKKEGIVIQILHIGSASDIYLDGKIKDGKPIKHVSERKGYVNKILTHQIFHNFISTKLFSLIIVFFTYFMFPVAFIQSSNFNDYIPNNFFNLSDTWLSRIIDLSVISSLGIISFILSLPHFYNIVKSEPPKSLTKCIIDEC